MIHEALEKIVAGEDLSRVEAEAAMEQILSGCASDAQIAGLLTALRMKGETVDELVGFATAMRRHATPIFAGNRSVAIEALVDTCGTGGDASGHIQCFDRGGVCGCGRGRPRREARQPLDQLALRFGGRARTSRRANRSAPGTRRPLDRRSRHRISICARRACGDAPCDDGAPRTAHAHGLQSSRAAHESSRRFGAGCGRLRSAA